MVKPLTFKGDKKTKKRKRVDTEEKFGDSSSKELALAKTQNEEEAAQDDDSWVTAEAATDVVGPILLVLPSDPPACIACDTNGKVFASLLENVIEADPTTAEPHDVRQVWVANRVAGTESFTFKGHHSKSVSTLHVRIELGADGNQISKLRQVWNIISKYRSRFSP